MATNTHSAADDDVRRNLAAIRKRIDEAAKITSVALENARAAVVTVRDEAQRSIAARVALLAEARASDPLAEAFGELDRSVSTHLDAVLVQVERQQEIAVRAAARCDDIMNVVRKLEDVAFSAKVLSLNAYISASSLAGGKVVAVLATTLSTLTKDVAAMSVRVASSAEQLLVVLPDVAAKAARLRDEALSFAEQFRADVARIAPKATAMNRIADESVASGDARLSTILGSSSEAYSALAYADEFASAVSDLRRRANEIESVARTRS